MEKSLRALIVEDSEDDAMLLVRQLQRDGFAVISERADTEETMQAALLKSDWDVIISDYMMPSFGGRNALEVLQKTGRDIPFILISGKIGEEIAVEVMRAGANDVVMKNYMQRLAPAIKREMTDAANRRERRKVEESLRQSEARLRLLLEQVPSIVWTTDKQLRFTSSQGAGLAALKLRPGELNGRTLAEYLATDASENTVLLSHLRAMMGIPSHAEFTEPRSGHTMYAYVEALKDTNGTVIGTVAAALDITDRKLMEDELRLHREHLEELVKVRTDELEDVNRRLTEDIARRELVEKERERLLAQVESERKRVEELAWTLLREKDILQVIMENASARVAYLDPDFKLVRANTSFAMNLNRTAADIIGRDYFGINPDKELRGIFERVRDTGAAESFHDRPFVQADHPEKGITYWDWTLIPVKDTANRVQGLVYSLIDTTERKKIDQLKDEFISMVSHELRNPLTIVIGSLSTLASEWGNLPQVEANQLIDDALSGSESLADILDNLLEMSRSQAGRLRLATEPLDIRSSAMDVVKRIKKQVTTHRLVVDIPRGLPLVQADRLKLERILHNLIENAIKYSAPGTEVCAFAHPDTDKMVIGIKDHGIGISPSEREQLFKPFARLESAARVGAKGIGLGLVVCQRLVEAHRGRIWVESEPGEGSVFYFTLPLDDIPVEGD